MPAKLLTKASCRDGIANVQCVNSSALDRKVVGSDEHAGN
jgi:hypothetical protein